LNLVGFYLVLATEIVSSVAIVLTQKPISLAQRYKALLFDF